MLQDQIYMDWGLPLAKEPQWKKLTAKKGKRPALFVQDMHRRRAAVAGAAVSCLRALVHLNGLATRCSACWSRGTSMTWFEQRFMAKASAKA